MVVHCRAEVKWQRRYADALVRGLEATGTEAFQTGLDEPTTAEASILLGPNYWQRTHQVLHDARRPLLYVNRAYWGDPDCVALTWGGFNGRGVWTTTEPGPQRWRQTGPFTAVWPPKPVDRRAGYAVLFGQVARHTRAFNTLDEWYRMAAAHVARRYPRLELRFRPHPAGGAGTGLRDATGPLAHVLADCVLAVTLNSTVAVDALLAGVETWADSSGSPAFGVAGTSWGADTRWEARQQWLHRLAWAQWSYDEIRAGACWSHLWSVPPVYRAPYERPPPV